MALVDWMIARASLVWKNITIEPLAFLQALIMSLSGIAANDLYLQKACQVSLTFHQCVYGACGIRASENEPNEPLCL